MVMRLRDRLDAALAKIEKLEAELAVYRDLPTEYHCFAGNDGRHRVHKVDPRSLKDNEATWLFELADRERTLALMSPAADWARAVAAGEMREDAFERQLERERELRKEIAADKAATAERLSEYARY
jgi:hypothetical protein